MRPALARYQQYFAVRAILERIAKLGPDGTRAGGVVWHTQGSGKSLTMVMLAEATGRAGGHRRTAAGRGPVERPVKH